MLRLGVARTSVARSIGALRLFRTNTLCRGLATEAKAEAKAAPAAAAKKEKTPEEKAVRREARKKLRAEKKAARPPQFGGFPYNPKKVYLGTRAAVDTERTIDRLRFKQEVLNKPVCVCWCTACVLIAFGLPCIALLCAAERGPHSLPQGV